MLVCITGLSGSGKTTVMKMIAKKGFDTFIMDDWIHQIYKTNGIGFILIKETFGNEYITARGVDRKKLGQLVFSNKNKLAKLNNIMIPVMQSKLAELKATGKLIFVELAVYLHHPLKFKKYFSKVICILRKKNIKKTRLFKKNFIPKKFPTIAVGNSQKITLCSNFLCSYFVENYRNIRNLEKQIENFLTFYKK